jgi:Skp family chaperone for outer membrane proteins
MNFLKAMWQVGLCAVFAIGLSFGLSAHATEPGGCEEKALTQVQETQEGVAQELQEMKGEVEQESQEMESKAIEGLQQTQEDVEQKLHETTGE